MRYTNPFILPVRSPLRTLKQVKVYLCHLTQNKRIEEARTALNGLVVARCDYPDPANMDLQVLISR